MGLKWLCTDFGVYTLHYCQTKEEAEKEYEGIMKELISAARRGHKGEIEHILSLFDIKYGDDRALLKAAEREHEECYQLILRAMKGYDKYVQEQSLKSIERKTVKM